MGVLETADQFWNGELDTAGINPVAQPTGELAEVADRTAFISGFANVTLFDTGDGLMMVDAGSPFSVAQVHERTRGWRPDRLDTCVYTHGHIDHVFAVPTFDAEAERQGWPRPKVVSHRNVVDRFDRYVMTAGYNGAINRRQFGVPDLQWPTDYRYPDETYDADLTVEVGDTTFELHHDRGETDDHTWVWIPDRGVLCTGDLFIWCVPNAGNPQKVPRYCREWAVALREMATTGAEVLLPGHGFPILGADRVRTALTDTAEFLESVHDQTVALMNEGRTLDEVIHGVVPPAALMEKPYLRPVYDDPEFIVRNIWRLYGGWFDLDPSHLKPAPAAAVATEMASLAGGAGRLAERAIEIADDGDLRLAAHLVEMAAQAAPGDAAIHSARADIYQRRVKAEPSLMAKGVFGAAARESTAAAGDPGLR
jgi:alkyl sulfatase BDS1-like metallo-beta-lactamase superfamily hydrolase